MPAESTIARTLATYDQAVVDAEDEHRKMLAMFSDARSRLAKEIAENPGGYITGPQTKLLRELAVGFDALMRNEIRLDKIREVQAKKATDDDLLAAARRLILGLEHEKRWEWLRSLYRSHQALPRAGGVPPSIPAEFEDPAPSEEV